MQEIIEGVIEEVLTMILFFVFAYVWTEIVFKGSIILAAIILGAFVLSGANIVAKWIVNSIKI